MRTKPSAPTTADLLEGKLYRQIELRTWGRVQQLHVTLNAGGVVVQGWSPSYYVKQLVLAAVRDVLPSTPVDLDIEVLDNFAHTPLGWDRSPNAP